MRVRLPLLLPIAALLAVPACRPVEEAPDRTDTSDASASPDTASAADTTGLFDSATPGDTTSPADSAAADTAQQDTALDSGLEDTATPLDTAPACAETPVPFAPSSSTGDWNHSVSTPLAVATGGPNHRGQDVVAKVGEPQRLVGKFAYSFFDTDLKDEDVEVWVQREVPCGAWELLGVANTTENDELGTVWGIEDDGGRVFFEVPVDLRLPVGRYPIRMLVDGDHSRAEFDLVVVEAGTGAVVFDIDGTLTTGDEELIAEIAVEIFNGTYDQHLRAGAVEVVQSWFDKGYLIIYLTGRPDFLRPMTERWVEEHGFPPGVMHLTDTNTQVVPSNDGVGVYKRDFLLSLLGASSGLDIYAAYGNATTDIWGFGEAGVPKARTFIVDKHGGEEGTVEVSSYGDHLPAAQAMPAATVPAPPAHGWW